MTTIYPSPADLKVEAKPLLSPAALGSENALIAHDDAVESWGERGWAAIGRLCRWSVRNGNTLPFECPKPEDDQ